MSTVVDVPIRKAAQDSNPLGVKQEVLLDGFVVEAMTYDALSDTVTATTELGERQMHGSSWVTVIIG